MVVLSLSFSLDLIAGAALGLIGTSIFVAAPLLGIVSGLTAMVGLRLGRVVSDRVGRTAEVLAAVALVAIAVGIVG